MTITTTRNVQEVVRKLRLAGGKLSKVAERFAQGAGLANLPSHLYIGRRPREGQYVAVELGGTNLRAAKIKLKIKNEKLKIDWQSKIIKGEIPCRRKNYTVEEFWGEIVRKIKPALCPRAKIGLVFAYAIEITPQLDGRLLYWTKEIKTPGMVGRLVGAEFGKSLRRAGFGECRVVVLNDTVATLLAGRTEKNGRNGEKGLIGLVVGTGMNLALVENDGQVVNTEAAGLDIAGLDLRTEFDKKVDRDSLNRGKSQLEKLISGLYLPRIFNAVIGEEKVKSAAELVKLNGEERKLAGAIFRRSARLAGAVVCGAILRSIKGDALYRAGWRSRKQAGDRSKLAVNVKVVAEGSVFWQVPGYKKIVEETVIELCPKTTVEFVKIEETGLAGAGIAAALDEAGDGANEGNKERNKVCATSVGQADF